MNRPPYLNMYRDDYEAKFRRECFVRGLTLGMAIGVIIAAIVVAVWL